MEFDLVQIAMHPATVTGSGGLVLFLANKVWRGHRHEIANMKQATENHAKILEKLFDKIAEHSDRDIEQFREIAKSMSDNHAELLRVLGTKADRR